MIHADPANAHRAIDTAFRVVERVHAAMSFHDPASDLSRLNRLGWQEPVRVGPETYDVLERAGDFHDRTRGVFDVTVAVELVRWGLLPRHRFARTPSDRDASGRHIRLLPGRRVRFLRPLWVDLGGIAKGFAVDQAVAALQEAGAAGGLVNAGGDLRCFGASRAIWVRDPRRPGVLLPLPVLADAALATSANAPTRRAGRTVCTHVDGRTRRPALQPFGVSVRAPSCVVADALTKVVLALGEAAAPLLAEFGAQAHIVRPGTPPVALMHGRA